MTSGTLVKNKISNKLRIVLSESEVFGIKPNSYFGRMRVSDWSKYIVVDQEKINGLDHECEAIQLIELYNQIYK